MSLNVVSAKSVLGFYCYNQINAKKDLALDNLVKLANDLIRADEDSYAELKPIVSTFKEELNKGWEEPKNQEEIKKRIKQWNIATIVGYIPIIGTIVGIARWVFSQKYYKKFSDEIAQIKARANDIAKETAYDKVLVPGIKDVQSLRRGVQARAMIETASLGFLLIIPDLIVSIGRYIERRKEAAQSAKLLQAQRV